VRELIVTHRKLVESYAATRLRFTLDGRLVGDIAEATAAEAFGLDLCRVRTPGVDALTATGRSVQVKSSGIGKGPAFTPGEGRADYLIFLLIDFEQAVAYVRYNGPEAPVRATLAPDFAGTKRVPLSKILELDAIVPDAHRLVRMRLAKSAD
jgi:hypothetical protein